VPLSEVWHPVAVHGILTFQAIQDPPIEPGRFTLSYHHYLLELIGKGGFSLI